MLTTHAFPGLGLNDAFAASVAQLLAARSPQQRDESSDDKPDVQVICLKGGPLFECTGADGCFFGLDAAEPTFGTQGRYTLSCKFRGL